MTAVYDRLGVDANLRHHAVTVINFNLWVCQHPWGAYGTSNITRAGTALQELGAKYLGQTLLISAAELQKLPKKYALGPGRKQAWNDAVALIGLAGIGETFSAPDCFLPDGFLSAWVTSKGGSAKVRAQMQPFLESFRLGREESFAILTARKTKVDQSRLGGGVRAAPSES